MKSNVVVKLKIVFVVSLVEHIKTCRCQALYMMTTVETEWHIISVSLCCYHLSFVFDISSLTYYRSLDLLVVNIALILCGK